MFNVDDDDDLEGGGGILNSAGLRDYENVSTRLAPEGVNVKLNCRRCNKPRIVTLEWAEVAAIANNGPGLMPLFPAGWSFSPQNKTPYVSMKCPSCGNETGFAIHLPVPEAQQHIKTGIASGAVDPGLVQQVAHGMNAQRARGHG